MNNDKHDRMPEQLEEHSLPGTNQAGTGPGDCAQDDDPSKAGAGTAPETPATRRRSVTNRDGATT